MKKVVVFISILLFGCASNQEKSLNNSEANEEVKPLSLVEKAYNIPLTQGSGGGNLFVSFLPNGKFVSGTIDYNGGNWIYTQYDESEYTGRYKVINDNLIEVYQKQTGKYGGEYNWNFQFQIVKTFGGKAFELRAINKNGTLTNDNFLWYTSADIDVAPKLNFK